MSSRMRLLSHIFPDAVVNRLMVKLRHSLVGSGFVRVERRTRLHVVSQHALKLLSTSAANRLDNHLVRVPIFKANHCHLTNPNPSSSLKLLALPIAHRLPLAANPFGNYTVDLTGPA